MVQSSACFGSIRTILGETQRNINCTIVIQVATHTFLHIHSIATISMQLSSALMCCEQHINTECYMARQIRPYA